MKHSKAGHVQVVTFLRRFRRNPKCNEEISEVVVQKRIIECNITKNMYYIVLCMYIYVCVCVSVCIKLHKYIQYQSFTFFDAFECGKITPRDWQKP